jgi:hypothetical protein
MSCTGPTHVVDSGVTRHFSPYKDDFAVYKPGHAVKITCADGKVLLSKGSGNIKISVPNGDQSREIMPTKALYMPNMAHSLISVPALDTSGCEVVFGSSVCKIWSPTGALVSTIPMHGSRLYLIDDMNQSNELATSAVMEHTVDSLHRILGHVAHNSIIAMVNKGLIQGMSIDPKSKPSQCKTCILAKIMRAELLKKRSGEPAKAYGDVVHTDLWGWAPRQLLGKHCYYMSITDEFSRETRLYLMKKKSEAFSIYKAHVAWVRNHRGGTKIKCLHSNRGGKFISDAFSKYLKKKGTTRQLTVHNMPAQNGISERRNRTIME